MLQGVDVVRLRALTIPPRPINVVSSVRAVDPGRNEVDTAPLSGKSVSRVTMEPKRRASLMIAAFAGLLAFHLWLLYRMLVRGDVVLSTLLLVAIVLFVWRIHHYGSVFRVAAPGTETKGPADELRQIRTMIPVLAALLALHAWLISLLVAAPASVERSAFLALLLLAVAIFVTRLGFYARRYATLRRTGR